MTHSLKTFASLGTIALALTTFGCDKEGSLGDYPTTSEGSGGSGESGGTGDTGGTESDSASASASTSASTSASSGSATETSADSGDPSATGGGLGCGPGQCETFPLECPPDGCGGLSRIGEDGCFRPGCATDDQCADDERCYRPFDFGMCASSDIVCDDDFEAMECSCGSTDDCGGSWCVPADAYPVPAEGPSDAGAITDDCAPDDGPAMSFVFGLASECGGPTPPESAVVRIRIDGFDDTTPVHEFGLFTGLGQGSYDVGDGVRIYANFGRLTIDAWDDSGVTGSYEILLEDGGYYASTFEANYCPEDPMCG